MPSKKTETYTYTALVGDQENYPDTYSVTGALAASSRKEAMDKIDASARSRGYEVLDLDLRKA
ncbi:hypothetical protein ACH4LK_04635 [Streptomyces lydicus]|uniref:hypothetical protein n=1 Tax=Streptomyces lydicus TaxID=47763 RepID=UPI003797DB8D